MPLAPVRLSKFSYLAQIGIAALVAALATPASVALIGLAGGVFLADLLVTRKPFGVAAVNAGRETLGFAVAYGFYALALQVSGAATLSLDFMATFVVLACTYFAVTRVLFYLSLILRGKLEIEVRLFILRWEIIAFFMNLLGAAILFFALSLLTPASWI